MLRSDRTDPFNSLAGKSIANSLALQNGAVESRERAVSIGRSFDSVGAIVPILMCSLEIGITHRDASTR